MSRQLSITKFCLEPVKKIFPLFRHFLSPHRTYKANLFLLVSKRVTLGGLKARTRSSAEKILSLSPGSRAPWGARGTKPLRLPPFQSLHIPQSLKRWNKTDSHICLEDRSTRLSWCLRCSQDEGNSTKATSKSTKATKGVSSTDTMCFERKNQVWLAKAQSPVQLCHLPGQPNHSANTECQWLI